jgi:glycosyltransferase involved in cell wall biosynthesis
LKALIRFLYKRKPPLYALSCYLKARRPAAIVSFLNYPNITLLLAAQAGAGDSKVLVNVRNHVSSSVVNAKSRRMREMPVLMRNLFCYAERVIAPARDVGRDISMLTDTPMDRVSILYNPVYRDEIIAAAKALPGHPWLDSPADEPVILAVGKLMPQKDFATLLSAFSAFCAVRPAKLIVLGEGDGRADLLALAREMAIEDKVDFPGHVENPFAYYRRASLFVLSSAWEGLPNALLEAMALGCPVVSTACPGGAAEILDDGRYGRLVPVGDPEALAEAMRQTLSQPLPKETLIGRARDFSLEAAVDDYEHVLLGGANSTTPDSISRRSRRPCRQ